MTPTLAPCGTLNLVYKIKQFKQIPELTALLFVVFSETGIPQDASLLPEGGLGAPEPVDMTALNWLWRHGFLYRTPHIHSTVPHAVQCLLCDDVKQPSKVDTFHVEEHLFRSFTHYYALQGAPSIYKIEDVVRANIEEFLRAARYNNNKKDGETLSFPNLHTSPYLFMSAGGMGNINIAPADEEMTEAINKLLAEGRLITGDFTIHPYYTNTTLHQLLRVPLKEAPIAA